MAKKEILPNEPNVDFKKGFTVAQMAEKQGWPESLVWAISLDGKSDSAKYYELRWGIKKGRLKLF